MPSSMAEEAIYEMLSPMAEEAINEMTDSYTLNPEQFKRFFLTEAYGKPRPNVLPIVSSFTEDADGVILQLRYFERSLRYAHEKYMTEHEKDMKLRGVITRLVARMKKEMRSEEKERRSQRSMCQYLKGKTFTAKNNFLLSSKAEEAIKEMTDDALSPAEFEMFLQMSSGKPESKVLPTLRSFTRDVSGVIRQLVNLRKFLREAHKNYMAEHEKDKNVFNRIKRLIQNIEMEQDRETRKRRGQRSMCDYVKIKKN
ncbi:hypothetical protein AVEN_78077-1 [Araneus ventricosus]|uniref:Uncharacterized protein n=1 Tax=Araneus ventricosus TaxID=182803 RepID=A0A4Y2F7V8_ARAVE|nr:hypothetical protein AVEN_78077-1 [Araneus ventricosus]